MGEKEINIHVLENIDQLLLVIPQPRTWPINQACTLTRNQTDNLLVHSIVPNLVATPDKARHFIWNCAPTSRTFLSSNIYKSKIYSPHYIIEGNLDFT